MFNIIIIQHLFYSLLRLFAGFGLAVCIGVPCGLLLGYSKTFYDFVYPILRALISIPTLAWVPLLLIFTGIDDRTVVFAVFLGAFFAIVYSTLNGMRTIRKEHLWASQTMGISKIDFFFDVLIPGSLTSIISGLKLALAYSWRALVGAEMLAAGISYGIGYSIYVAKAFHDLQTMFLCLCLISVCGLLIDRLLIGTLEKGTVRKWGLVK